LGAAQGVSGKKRARATVMDDDELGGEEGEDEEGGGAAGGGGDDSDSDIDLEVCSNVQKNEIGTSILLI